MYRYICKNINESLIDISLSSQGPDISDQRLSIRAAAAEVNDSQTWLSVFGITTVLWFRSHRRGQAKYTDL